MCSPGARSRYPLTDPIRLATRIGQYGASYSWPSVLSGRWRRGLGTYLPADPPYQLHGPLCACVQLSSLCFPCTRRRVYLLCEYHLTLPILTPTVTREQSYWRPRNAHSRSCRHAFARNGVVATEDEDHGDVCVAVHTHFACHVDHVEFRREPQSEARTSSAKSDRWLGDSWYASSTIRR